MDSGGGSEMERERLGVGGLSNMSSVGSVGLGTRMKATGFWQGRRRRGRRQQVLQPV